MKRSRNWFDIIAFATLLVPAIAGAVDGVILIDQNRALAGGVAPGDTAGFPVTITRPGSYRLSGNLTVPGADTTAIEITANDVTIDLNGFAIIGGTVCTGTPRVISCTPTGTGRAVSATGANVAVLNGTVRGMAADGVVLFGSGQVERVRAEGNGGTGIAVTTGTVIHNIAVRNGFGGFSVDEGSVSHNTSSGNRSFGFATAAGVLSHNTASKEDDGLLLGANSGYVGNVIANALTPVRGGVSLGHNLCNGAVC